MQEIQTLYFGKMAFHEDAVVYFPSGLPGFDDQTSFLLIEREAHKPLVYVQSLSTPDLCFLALPILTVCSDYHLSPSPEDLHLLELPPDPPPAIGRDVLCLTLLSLTPHQSPTANLLAPLVINLKTRKGVQVIHTDSPYSHCHPLISTPEEALC